MNTEYLEIPQLVSGGLMMSYKCTNRCKHCLYNSSPEHSDWISIEMVEKIFSVLQGEYFLKGLHIGGGEPFLNTGLLEKIITLANKMEVPVQYVETNAFFATDDDKTLKALQRMHDCGLRGLLISISPFHNEFIPLERVKRCLRIATEVFGRNGVIPWLPVFLNALDRLDASKTHSIDEFLDLYPDMKETNQLAGFYSLIQSGRTPYELGNLQEKYPIDHLLSGTCRNELLNTTHFHFDLYGNYVPGLCAGISIANAGEFNKEVSFKKKPFIGELYRNGLEGLYNIAVSEHGFNPDPGGYTGKCHACLEMRKHILKDTECSEFQPVGYYK